MTIHTINLKVGEPAKLPDSGWLEKMSWLEKSLMAFGCGCLLGLSAPGFDVWWLAWIGLVPLLVLIRSNSGKLEAALTGFIFAIGYNLVSLCWILGLYPLQWLGLNDWLGFQGALAVWLAEACHQSLLIAAFALFVHVLPMRAGMLPNVARPYFPYLLSVPLIWLFFQWLIGTSEFFLGVPVNELAYSQSRQLELIQIAKLGGGQLVDFLIVFTNTAIAALLIERARLVRPFGNRIDPISSGVGAYVDVILAAILVSAAFFWGKAEVATIASAASLTAPLSSQHVPVPVAVIQGNVTIEDERAGAMTPAEITNRYTSLLDNLGVALVVLPEGVVNAAKQGQMNLLDRLKEHVVTQKKEALAGTLEVYGGGTVNALRVITPTGDNDTLYVKRRLVPFGEYIPLGILGDLVPERLKALLVGASGGFQPARNLLVPKSIWGKIGASVCVEVIYPHLIAEEVRKGASVLVNVSNLAWFHNATLNRQVLAAAVFRAVENGRYLVLATNTGISAVINPSGFVTSASLPGRRGVLVDTVQFLYQKTPFTKMWWL